MLRRLALLSVCILLVSACQIMGQQVPQSSSDEESSYYVRTAHIQSLKAPAQNCKSQSKAGSVYADNLILWTDYKNYLEAINQIEKITREQEIENWVVKQELAYDRGICLVALYQINTDGVTASNWDCRVSATPIIERFSDSNGILSELSSESNFECHSNFDHQRGMVSLIGSVDGLRISSHLIRK